MIDARHTHNWIHSIERTELPKKNVPESLVELIATSGGSGESSGLVSSMVFSYLQMEIDGWCVLPLNAVLFGLCSWFLSR